MKNNYAIRWNLRPKTHKVFWLESVFNDEEIQNIKNIAEKIPFEESGVVDAPKSRKVRSASVSWIPPSQESEWLYKKLVDLVLLANSMNYNFNLVGFESLQFTMYEASENDFYETHIDVFSEPQNYLNRKLSFSVQLSDPSEYEGGELLIEPLNEVVEAKKTKGSIIFFGSTERHQIKPVTKGVRYALVGWVSGPSLS
jgi:PKHD-type hydroxylase